MDYTEFESTSTPTHASTGWCCGGTGAHQEPGGLTALPHDDRDRILPAECLETCDLRERFHLFAFHSDDWSGGWWSTLEWSLLPALKLGEVATT
ncbi:MAG: hypothetical protein AVDCRST_MAG87-333 [uncultured Thermomicrobiales bacterium]|uniref:Uncharacterized protein n=1 Tax=uncultured Thermomicrobiales bacterium TaxID=1645740 RepID=A0A6J4UAM9_9BACT|nr:MAG: hypothetical protein AVDCRST_MAG87-333 [uncultured Thermomicrobiales bacterium]